jgi:transcriptional regulator with XRE-family HTH domain
VDGNTIRDAIARHRRARGLSQAELAERLAIVSGRPTVTRHDISRWERGVRTPRPFWLRHLAVALEIEPATLAGTVDTGSTAEAIRVAHEWLVSRPPHVRQLSAGRRVGSELAQTVERRVIELRRLDDQLGGVDTLPLVERELAAVEHVLNEASYTEETGRRLLRAVGELAQVAGWVASDAGQYARAQRHYLRGVRAAHAAGARLIAANLLSSLAYQVANVGPPRDAALLAATAVRGAEAATGRVRALLLERVAWAYARVGDATEADRVLAEVDEAFETATDEEPDWVYWLDRGEIDIMAGRVNVELRRPLRAVPLLSTAIASYDTNRAREIGLYETWLAESYIQANELDAAVATLRSAEVKATQVHSARLMARVRHVRRVLSRGT